MRPPRTRYATSGGLNIAFQVFGEGMDVVVVPGFISHLDLLWENPERAAIYRRLARFARVTVFDKRNTGLSDRTGHPPTIEERMDDIRAVMDAAGIERAALLGYSEGGPLAILFAATYPHRATAVVVVGSIVMPLGLDEETEARLQQAERLWGTGAVLPFFLPGVDQEWAARYERSAATPRAAMEILRLNTSMDVRSALSSVAAPMLVVHRTGDDLVPVEHGRTIAELAPDVRYIEVEGEGHLPSTPEEWQRNTDLIEEFLTGERRSVEPDRVLATVLFTDIVGSTERAAQVGDRRWRELLEQHQRLVERSVSQHRGRQVKTTGDGVVATFDGPGRAIRCAVAIVERAQADGIPVRAGLHTGEVELVDGGDIAGIAVHLAQRVEAAASPGTVFVSQTVRDLVAGSGIEFADRGLHELKGVPGEWRLFEVASAVL